MGCTDKYPLCLISFSKCVHKAEQDLLEKTEMGMLRWMTAIKKIEKTNLREEIRAKANTSDKIRESRLRRLET